MVGSNENKRMLILRYLDDDSVFSWESRLFSAGCGRPGKKPKNGSG